MTGLSSLGRAQQVLGEGTLCRDRETDVVEPGSCRGQGRGLPAESCPTSFSLESASSLRGLGCV